MPDINGDRLALQMRELRSDIPIVLMSGYNEVDIGEFYSHSSASSDFIKKPFRASDLVNRTLQVMGQGRAEFSATRNMEG